VAVVFWAKFQLEKMSQWIFHEKNGPISPNFKENQISKSLIL